jgi:hypothetical protein
VAAELTGDPTLRAIDQPVIAPQHPLAAQRPPQPAEAVKLSPTGGTGTDLIPQGQLTPSVAHFLILLAVPISL